MEKRKSGIELYKIMAAFLIVLGHVTDSLTNVNSYIASNDYMINLKLATRDYQYVSISFMNWGGSR